MTRQGFGDWLKQNRRLVLLIAGLTLVFLVVWAIEAVAKPRRAAPMRFDDGPVSGHRILREQDLTGVL